MMLTRIEDTHMTKKTNQTVPEALATPANKKEKLIALLRREDGATLAQITEATSWLPHSARAMLTGLRKKGFGIEKAKVEGATRYSIVAEPAA